MANIKSAQERKDICVCIRITKEDQILIKKASRGLDIRPMTFIRDAVLKEAKKIVKG